MIIFGRTPERGRVKTRLAPALGESGALQLYRAFLSDSLHLARHSGATVVLARTAGGPFPELELADRVVVQEGEEFGPRMDSVLSRVARELSPRDPYVILGADAPHLPPRVVRGALDALAQGPGTAALGACQAGGFYLLGFRGPPTPITPAFQGVDEAAGVLRILEAAGRAPMLLPEFFDIDTPADLDRLVDHLAAPPPSEDPWIPEATIQFLTRFHGGVERSHWVAGPVGRPRPSGWRPGVVEGSRPSR